jgi:hypothetical protein
LDKLDNLKGHEIVGNKHHKADKPSKKKPALHRSYTDTRKDKHQKKDEFKNLFKVYEPTPTNEINLNNSSDCIMTFPPYPIQIKFKSKSYNKEGKEVLQGIETIK